MVIINFITLLLFYWGMKMFESRETEMLPELHRVMLYGSIGLLAFSLSFFVYTIVRDPGYVKPQLDF